MLARKFALLALLVLSIQFTAATARQHDELTPVDSKAFTKSFGARNVVCEISTSIENGLTPGITGNIVISFFSSVNDGGQSSDNAKAVALNGLVAVALPPGLEMAGESKLHFFNPKTGQYELMYSGTYPQNTITAGLEQAMANASASNPRQIIGGLSEICEQLSPGSGFTAPIDPRISGANSAYSVAGKSWLVPMSLMQNEVVNTFNLPDSIAKEARLKVSFPFRVTGEILGNTIAVYAGGLNTGATQVVLAPADIPPGALPLMPILQDANGNQDTTAIPTIVYSHQWVTWETEFTLSDYITSQVPAVPESDRFRFKGQNENEADVQGTPGSSELSPAPESPVTPENAQPEPAPELTPVNVPVEPQLPAQVEPQADNFREPFIGFDSGSEPATVQPVIPPPTPAVVEPSPAPTPTPTPAAPATQVAKPAPVHPAVPTSAEPVTNIVQEVELGTIPDQDTDYRVPLKQITGSAQGNMQPQQQDWTQSDTGGGPAFLDEQVFVEEGYFLMGTSNLSSAGDQDELPQTSVFLPDFYIDKYPVTNRKFQEFVIDAGYNPEGKWRKYYSKGTADLPVRGVTWNDADEFAKWAGKRLPTEAEWEKAARGADGRLYPWGDNWSSDILPRGELIYDIMHAESAASPYGAMSMVGVFWQWTSSHFGIYPYDPNAVSDEYVLRGGCFSNGRNIVRCANRYSQPPNVALNTFSFRCASDPQ